MKKLLNTLYINQQETYVHKERETIVIKRGDEKLAQFPALVINGIYCFGQVTVSPPLMGYCVEQRIELAFFSEFGKFLARVVGAPTGNVLLRRTQYRWADENEKSVNIARLMVAAKIANCRTVLLREQRNHGENLVLTSASHALEAALRNVRNAQTIPAVIGIEGEAAATYFGIFNELLHTQAMPFNGRVRRPPTDPVNALLSFCYTLLTAECASALNGVGLDPYVGFLHQDRPGRKSLALDLMEEFRAPLADRFVLTLLNRGQIKVNDFVVEASGAVRLKDEIRKELLKAYQERKQEEIMHPYLEEKIPIGLLPHAQALLLARHLRGDLALYPPYIVR